MASIVSVFIVPGYTQLRTKRYTKLQKFLARKGISSLVYDYRTLLKRNFNKETVKFSELLRDTQSAFRQFTKELTKKKYFVLGYSIGSYVVPMMLDKFTDTLGIILVSPPAYSSQTEKQGIRNLLLGISKSEIQDNMSPIFIRLNGLRKKLLLIFGDWDQEIPIPIRKRFKEIECSTLSIINIPQGVHSLLRDRNPSEKLASRILIEKIYEYIDKNSKAE